MEARTTTAQEYHNGSEFRGIAVSAHVGAKPSKLRQVVIAPYLSGRVDYGAHNNNLPNLIRALNERVFNVQGPNGLEPTPQPEPGAWRKLDQVAVRLADRIRKFGRCESLTCVEFIDQCPANKRKLYASAAEQYLAQGWGNRDARIKAFVKFEKLNFTVKTDPAPRVIQPRSPVYNIALGRYTRKVEASMYKALAKEWGEEGEVVMKGMTVEEVAGNLRQKWLKFSSPVAVGLDASRFDQHISKSALKWEHSIYKRIFDYNPELIALCKAQLANSGFAFVDGHKLTYKADGTRASGDMNTSLGNCIIMCTLAREFLREQGVTAEFANNGDDCLIFMERSDLSKVCDLKAEGAERWALLSGWFLNYGFKMEVEEPVYEFEHCVFCQSQPVLLDASTDSYVMCRQPASAFGKDAMSLAVETELGFRQWSYQVGVGGSALFGDLPIFGELYKAYKRSGVGSNVGQSLVVSDSGFMRMCAKPRIRGEFRGEISDDTRVSFFKAFGNTLETRLNNV
jgi:hypothetical protein